MTSAGLGSRGCSDNERTHMEPLVHREKGHLIVDDLATHKATLCSQPVPPHKELSGGCGGARNNVVYKHKPNSGNTQGAIAIHSPKSHTQIDICIVDFCGFLSSTNYLIGSDITKYSRLTSVVVFHIISMFMLE